MSELKAAFDDMIDEMIKRSSALDVQHGGDHYKLLGDYQPWEVLARWLTPDELRGFAKGTMIAYLARERDKGGLGDISKAIHTGQLFEELLKTCEAFHAEKGKI
jgi:hypothetical protein